MKKASGKSNIDILKDYVAGERPFVQVGFIGEKNKYRNEGETWTDKDGVKYRRENGKNVRLTKTQGDIIREAIEKGMDCKSCGMQYKWADKNDLKVLGRTGLCANCLIDYETKLRIVGIYPDYEKYKLLSYEIGALKDAYQQIEGAIKFFSESTGDVTMLCNSDGFTERWKNTNQDKIMADAKIEFEWVGRRLAEITKEKEEAKSRYKEGTKKYKLEYYA